MGCPVSRLALPVLLLALPCLAQESAVTCVTPATDRPESGRQCMVVHCYPGGRCECPLLLPDGRKNSFTDGQCERLRKTLPVYRMTAPSSPEKAPKDSDPAKSVDLTTPQQRKHILDGEEGDPKRGGHRPGTGRPGKSEFPKDWSDDKIIHEISDVATDPRSERRPGRGNRTEVEGTRNGVKILVILEKDGTIVTGFPLTRVSPFQATLLRGDAEREG